MQRLTFSLGVILVLAAIPGFALPVPVGQWDFNDSTNLGQATIGNDLVLMKYLYKCETFPVVWYFTFYRTSPRGERTADTGDSWRVIIVRFDTELELLGLDG